MTEHPITPPDELVQQWLAAPEYAGERMMVSMTERRLQEIADKAARWGFNQRGAVNEAELQKARDEELLESCKWLHNARNHGLGYDIGQSLAANLRAAHGLGYDIGQSLAANLRAARRPKPPSLKAQALEALRDATGSDYPHPMTVLNAEQHSLICRALETLPDD